MAATAFALFSLACVLACVPGVPANAGLLGLAVCLLGALAYREVAS